MILGKSMVKTLDATLIHTNCHADVLHIHSPRTVSVDVCKSTPRFLQLEKELEEHSEQLGFNKKLCAVDLQITLYDEFAKLCQHVKGLQLIKWKIQIINVKQKHRSSFLKALFRFPNSEDNSLEQGFNIPSIYLSIYLSILGLVFGTVLDT